MSFMEDPHPWRVEDGDIVDATGAYIGPTGAVAELERLWEQRAAVLREIERGGPTRPVRRGGPRVTKTEAAEVIARDVIRDLLVTFGVSAVAAVALAAEMVDNLRAAGLLAAEPTGGPCAEQVPGCTRQRSHRHTPIDVRDPAEPTGGTS